MRSPGGAFSFRASGVLVHITSLPGSAGSGDLGSAAHDFVQLLGQTGQSWWQTLPVGPAGEGFSPYAARSSFAGGAHLVSLEPFVRSGLLDTNEVQLPTASKSGRVDLAAVRRKERLGRLAAVRFFARRRRREQAAFEAFCDRASSWLDDAAIFEAIARAEGSSDWTTWPAPLRLRRASAMRSARRDLADEINCAKFMQFHFDRQWKELRRRCGSARVGLLGDVPFFPSLCSADVWANRRLFDLDAAGRPNAVAGVPPDGFSPNGQIWRSPLYNWSVMAKDDYSWWVARLARALELFDAVRLDHFIGFTRSWRVPTHARNARHGSWLAGPGASLLDAVQNALPGASLVAEDLGVVTPQVRQLRDAFNLPGMCVLQFAFDGDCDSPHLPHNHVRNSAVYTGTHDNNTAQGWVESLERSARGRITLDYSCRYLHTDPHQLPRALIRSAMASVARTAIIPLADALSLGSSARMNRPGTVRGNWRWRLTGREKLHDALDRLGALSQLYGRTESRSTR